MGEVTPLIPGGWDEEALLNQYDPQRTLISGYTMLSSKPTNGCADVNFTTQQIYTLEEVLDDMEFFWRLANERGEQSQQTLTYPNSAGIYMNLFEQLLTRENGLSSFLTMLTTPLSPKETSDNLMTKLSQAQNSNPLQPSLQATLTPDEALSLAAYTSLHFQCRLAYSPFFWRDNVRRGPEAQLVLGLTGINEILEKPENYDIISQITDPPLPVDLNGDPLHNISEYFELQLRTASTISLAFLTDFGSVDALVSGLKDKTREKLQGGTVFTRFNRIPLQIDVESAFGEERDSEILFTAYNSNGYEEHNAYTILEYLDGQFNRLSKRPSPSKTMAIGEVPDDPGKYSSPIVRTLMLFKRREMDYEPLSTMRIVPSRHFSRNTKCGLYFEGLTLDDISEIPFRPDFIYSFHTEHTQNPFLHAKTTRLICEEREKYHSQFKGNDPTPDLQICKPVGATALELAKNYKN